MPFFCSQNVVLSYQNVDISTFFPYIMEMRGINICLYYIL
nr:MAG TPA: hypothetical protein [Caudoviricetes sp.]